MTALLEAISRYLPHKVDDFDIDAAARAHHDRLMGHDLTLEERRKRARSLIAAPTAGRATRVG